MDLIKRDTPFEIHIAKPMSWRNYLFIILKFILLFYILTLFMEDYLFFSHHGQPWLIADFALIALYFLTIIFALAQMIKGLPMAAIMLASPIIPLVMLILTVVSLPILHHVHQKITVTWIKK